MFATCARRARGKPADINRAAIWVVVASSSVIRRSIRSQGTASLQSRVPTVTVPEDVSSNFAIVGRCSEVPIWTGAAVLDEDGNVRCEVGLNAMMLSTFDDQPWVAGIGLIEQPAE